ALSVAMWTLPLSGGDIKQNRRRQWHSPHPPRGQAPGKNWHLYGCWGQGDFATGIGWRRRHYGFNGDTAKWTVGVFLDRIELGARVRITSAVCRLPMPPSVVILLGNIKLTGERVLPINLVSNRIRKPRRGAYVLAPSGVSVPPTISRAAGPIRKVLKPTRHRHRFRHGVQGRTRIESLLGARREELQVSSTPRGTVSRPDHVAFELPRHIQRLRPETAFYRLFLGRLESLGYSALRTASQDSPARDWRWYGGPAM